MGTRKACLRLTFSKLIVTSMSAAVIGHARMLLWPLRTCRNAIELE